MASLGLLSLLTILAVSARAAEAPKILSRDHFTWPAAVNDLAKFSAEQHKALGVPEAKERTYPVNGQANGMVRVGYRQTQPRDFRVI